MALEISPTALQTQVIPGKDIPEKLIQLMEKQRIKEYGKNTKDFRNLEKDSVFFFLKGGQEIRAFGMLKPVTVFYDDQEYPIMGIANVIAVEKSKGYGTFLMQQITRYLEEYKLAAIGNTHKDNFVFYEKCGYTFVPGLLKRFVYVKSDGQEVGTKTQDYNMFVFDPGGQLARMIVGDKRVVIKVPFW